MEGPGQEEAQGDTVQRAEGHLCRRTPGEADEVVPSCPRASAGLLKRPESGRGNIASC